MQTNFEMKKILHIIASARGDASHSLQLGEAIVRQLKLRYPGSTVTERTLADDDIPYLNSSLLNAFLGPEQAGKTNDKILLSYSNHIIEELKVSDIIILGSPMYNFGIPASLKAYIDQIIRIGHTFKYAPDGLRVGLLTDKIIYLAITVGGKYSDTGFDPTKQFIIDYLSTIFNFVGVDCIRPVIIEGTATPDFEVNYDKVAEKLWS